MSVLDVTTGVSYSTLSDAITGSGSGDTLDVLAGDYTEDFPKITHDLTITGVGGMPHLMPLGQPSNGEAALVQDTATLTLDNLEISGVTVPDSNGAAVRFETGTNLTLTNDWFHDNQDGVLGGTLLGATVTIDNSEFDHNGTEVGNTHNIYIGEITQLTVTNSYFHDALGGHEIKSRAMNNTITGNRIQDGPTSDTSYSIDLPNGGNATINGNVIEKGPASSNGSIIHYGGEMNPVYASSSLTISSNIIIDDNTAHGQVGVLNQSTDALGNPILPTVADNTFYGIPHASLSNDPVVDTGNTFDPIGSAPALDKSHHHKVACFCAGTRILTARGEVAVEHLRVGDQVVTVLGKRLAAVRWIGHRHVDCRRHPDPHAVWPIRVLTHAFGAGMPHRDLWLSPDHAVHWRDVLIPVRHLVNGMTITQHEVAEVSYFHVELNRHDILLAEGLAVESYLNTGNRSAFANGGGTVAAHPDFAQRVASYIWNTLGCAPLEVRGEAIETVRCHLVAMAPLPPCITLSDAIELWESEA